MPDEKRKGKSSQTIKRYRPPPVEEPPGYSVEMACPLCGRRACDLSDYSRETLWVGMKCPHCHNIIHINVRR